MLFERFEVKGLSQFSYAVGSRRSGEVALVDPERNAEIYLEWAARHGVRITHVLETHIHADFASGARELAEAAGAELRLSAHDAGELYEVAFAHVEMRDGETLALGEVEVRALHTPGHTPEHLSFLVTRRDDPSPGPHLMLSGDCLFVGSLGRPDLLGEESKVALAERLFDTVRDRLAPLPDTLEVHPGHGAGSLCGAGMSHRPSSTLGAERLGNPYLDPRLSREAFVERLLASLPPVPPYYRRMKRLNSAGPQPLRDLPAPRPVAAAEAWDLARADHVVVDVRDPASFAAGHVPGALGIGAGPSLSTWAAWAVPYENPLLLVVPGPAALAEALRSLVRVGLDSVVGYLEGGMASWESAGLPQRRTPQLSPAELARRLEGESLLVLDVRNDGEWEAGHVAGARHLMGGLLPGRLGELPETGGIVVLCASGYRSTVAASLLERAGKDAVYNLAGGMMAWQAAGFPVTTG